MYRHMCICDYTYISLYVYMYMARRRRREKDTERQRHKIAACKVISWAASPCYTLLQGGNKKIKSLYMF